MLQPLKRPSKAESDRRVKAITLAQKLAEEAVLAQGVLDPPDWVPSIGSFADDDPEAHKLFEDDPTGPPI